MRRIRFGIIIAACLVTLQSVLLVAGAWRNDRQIERHMGVAQAEVLSAGPRRSTIEFVTPDRVTYRPELGVLYPSELADGMRIYVEYDKNNPESRSGATPQRRAGDHPGWLDRGGRLARRGRVTGRVEVRREAIRQLAPALDRTRCGPPIVQGLCGRP